MTRERFPIELEICFTSNCNLSCAYCSSGRLLKEHGNAALTAKQIKRAIDLYAGYSKSNADIGIAKIGITGGEPFLYPDLLLDVAKYIKTKHKNLSLCISTNGTLLKNGLLRELIENGAFIYVSLDGIKTTNDKYRKFKTGNGSVFDLVTAKLKQIPKDCLPSVGIMATMDSSTIDTLVESAKLLKRFNCAEVELELDKYEFWRKNNLEKLGLKLKEFNKYYVDNADFIKQLQSTGRSFDCFFQEKLSADDLRLWRCLVLMPDGHFYPTVIAHTRDKKYSVGNLAEGLNFKKFEKIYQEARKVIQRHGNIGSVQPSLCRYFFSVTQGKNPAEILKSGRGVDKVFKDELGQIIEIERIIRNIQTARGFGDFTHLPVKIEKKEISLAVVSDKDMCKSRDVIDKTLYSPGLNKQVLIRAGASVKKTEILSLYCILKSKYLGKRIWISVEADEFSQDNLDFFNCHGIHAGIRKFDKQKNKYSRAYAVTKTQNDLMICRKYGYDWARHTADISSEIVTEFILGGHLNLINFVLPYSQKENILLESIKRLSCKNTMPKNYLADIFKKTAEFSDLFLSQN